MDQLNGKVAVVTGATRNGGRAIALALSEAGATVYVTGRSIRGAQTSDNPGSTLEDTAELIEKHGGTCVPVQVDHTVDEQVEALFEQVKAEKGCLDILVNNAWGGYETSDGFDGKTPFWELPLKQWDIMMHAGLRSHMMSGRLAMPLLLARGQGLIVNTTAGLHPLEPNNSHAFYTVTKVAINRLSYHMAEDCRPYGIAVVCLSLGDRKHFMRTWDVAYPLDDDDPTFSTTYVGRAVVALATVKNVMEKSGVQPYLDVPALARAYGFTDMDGRQP